MCAYTANIHGYNLQHACIKMVEPYLCTQQMVVSVFVIERMGIRITYPTRLFEYESLNNKDNISHSTYMYVMCVSTTTLVGVLRTARHTLATIY